MPNFRTPELLRRKHQELHEELLRAIDSGGELEKAAKLIEEPLYPHFMKEEEFALPPLGLLATIAEGKVDPEMRDVLTMTERLKKEMPGLIEDHLEIVQRLKHFDDAVKAEKKVEFSKFTEKISTHAQMEEDVLYPASILIGEYLQEKLRRC